MAFEISEYLEVASGEIFQIVAIGEDYFVLANIRRHALKAPAIGQVWQRDEMIAAIGRGYFRRMRTQ